MVRFPIAGFFGAFDELVPGEAVLTLISGEMGRRCKEEFASRLRAKLLSHDVDRTQTVLTVYMSVRAGALVHTRTADGNLLNAQLSIDPSENRLTCGLVKWPQYFHDSFHRSKLRFIT